MPASRITLIPASVLAVAAASVALAGCHSTSSSDSGAGTAAASSTQPAAGTGSAVAAAGTQAAPPASGKLTGVPKTCPSADEVMSNLHLTKLTVQGDDPSTCLYLYKGSKEAPYAIITFNAAPGLTPASLGEMLKKAQSDVKPVPGLADAAYSWAASAGGTGLTFLSGDTICSIDSSVPTTAADKTALARSILAG